MISDGLVSAGLVSAGLQFKSERSRVLRYIVVSGGYVIDENA
jgi:hypothetical protein